MITIGKLKVDGQSVQISKIEFIDLNQNLEVAPCQLLVGILKF